MYGMDGEAVIFMFMGIGGFIIFYLVATALVEVYTHWEKRRRWSKLGSRRRRRFRR